MSLTPSTARPRLVSVASSPFGGQVEPSTLPLRLTSLIGREREIVVLNALLRDPAVRLVTLTGVGGVGKTSLALRVGADLEANGDFADGVVLVDLTTIREHDLVIPVIAQTLDARGASQKPTLHALKRFLGDKHLLVILDNFEHVSEAAPTVVDLLASCPDLTVLVTSRSLLNVTGERVMPLLPLSLEAGIGAAAAARSEPILTSDAVRLFVERTRAVKPSFVLTAGNEREIAEIVQRLDGLPLAIELAAARGVLLSPSALLARLIHPLPYLTGGPRDQPARHQTMHAAIAWSYELLTPEEQRVFRCLGVFAGGSSLEAVAAICAPEDGSEPGVPNANQPRIEAELESLVRQSLVQAAMIPADRSCDGAIRVVMLETIREFAVEQLAARGEQIPGRRHAEYYADLAARAEPTYWGDTPGDWRAAIDRETGNLQVAVDWAIAHGETDRALQLASARFDPHWTTGALARVQRGWARQALAMSGGSPTSRQRALTTAAWLAHIHDDFAEGRSLAGEALALAREISDELGAANASFVLGVAAFHEGKMEPARVHLNDALATFRGLDAPGRTAWTLSYLASLDSRTAIDEGGDPAILARAVSLYEEALALFREVGNDHGRARALHGLAYVAWKQRDLSRALARSREVLHLDWEQHWPIYYHLEDIADIAGRVGQSEVAARLYGAADSLRARAGRPVEPVFLDEFQRDVAVARRSLGEAAFAQAWTAGQALVPEQAIEEVETFCALAARQGRVDVASAGVVPAGLTRRELDVLHQLVAGRTDREIAATLFITRRTASKHVEAILAKLGVRSRGAAVAEAIRQGLAAQSPSV